MTNTDAATTWGRVADAWDRHTDFVEAATVAVTQAFVDAARVRPGDRVLELAAGPGILGEAWSSRCGPSGRVLLSDLAPPMVEAAQRRNAAVANVDTAVLDASAIDQADGSFDVVACRMGLMFTPDPATAFGEIVRVLDGGGRCVAMTWAGPEHNPWVTCVGMAAAMNGLVAGGPPIGPGGIFSLGDESTLTAAAEAGGLAEVTVTAHPVVFEAADIDTHIDRVSSLAGPLAAAFAVASPEQLAAVRKTAADLAAPYVTASGVALPARALLLAAVSPG